MTFVSSHSLKVEISQFFVKQKPVRYLSKIIFVLKLLAGLSGTSGEKR